MIYHEKSKSEIFMFSFLEEPKMKKEMKVLVVCKHPRGSHKAEVCRLINHDGFRVIYSWKNSLTAKDLKGVDLVVSLGGDGTVLSASHYLIDKPILAVNSSPGKSEGALTTINVDEIGMKLDEIKKGNYETEKLERIEIKVDGKRKNILALNEVFVASEKAYLVSKYKMKFNEISEEQRSSGIIFSTGTGSTAWFRSAGGKPFRTDEKFIKFVVREPYFGRLGKFSITDGVVKEGEKVEVSVLADSVLAVDSIREFKLRSGERVEVGISTHPLLRIR